MHSGCHLQRGPHSADVVFLLSPQSGKKILLTKSLFQKVRVYSWVLDGELGVSTRPHS